MDTEELLRSYPADGAVLMGGCDKTTPGCSWARPAPASPAIYCPPGRCCAATPRPDARQRNRPVEVLGRRAAGHRRLRAGRPGSRHRPFARPLHDHGHRLHDDLGGRSAGHDRARGRLDPGGSLRALPDGRGQRRGGSCRWSGTTWAGRDLTRSVRGRGGHRAGSAGRPMRSSTWSRWPGGPASAHPGRLRRNLPTGAGVANIRPSGHVPDGGLLLRRRPAPPWPAGQGARRAAPGPANGHRRHVRGAYRRRDRLRRGRHPHPGAGPRRGRGAVLRELAPDGAVDKHIAAEPRLSTHRPGRGVRHYSEMQKD